MAVGVVGRWLEESVEVASVVMGSVEVPDALVLCLF